MGETHQRLARLVTGSNRASHVEEARRLWTSIDRPDLVAGLDREFGPPDAS